MDFRVRPDRENKAGEYVEARGSPSSLTRIRRTTPQYTDAAESGVFPASGGKTPWLLAGIGIFAYNSQRRQGDR